MVKQRYLLDNWAVAVQERVFSKPSLLFSGWGIQRNGVGYYRYILIEPVSTSEGSQIFLTAEIVDKSAKIPPRPIAMIGAFDVLFFKNASLGSSGSTYAVVSPPCS